MSATQGALLTVQVNSATTANKLVQSVFNIAGSGAATTYTYAQSYVWTSGISSPGISGGICDMAVDVTNKMLYVTYGGNFAKADITPLLAVTPGGIGGALTFTENTSPLGWPGGDCFQMVRASGVDLLCHV